MQEGWDIVDLSVTLTDRHPCTWPGHAPFQHTVWNWYESQPDAIQPLRSVGPYYTCMTVIDEHCGTHFDAAPHFVPPSESGLPHAGSEGNVYGDGVDLKRLQGWAAVVDVSALRADAVAGVSPLIEPDLFARWEDAHGRLCPGEVVLLQSGWSEHYSPDERGLLYSYAPVVERSAPGWPAPSAAAVRYLVDRGVRLLGTDGPSIGAAHDGAPMHYAGLERGMLYVESLARLEDLPARGSYFVFAPVKIARSSGGPGRAFALVDSTATGSSEVG